MLERISWPVPAILLLFRVVYIFPLENGIDRGTFHCTAHANVTVQVEKGDRGLISSATVFLLPPASNLTANLTDEGGGGQSGPGGGGSSSEGLPAWEEDGWGGEALLRGPAGDSAPSGGTSGAAGIGERGGNVAGGGGGGGGDGAWCEVALNACSTCKIHLTFVILNFPPCGVLDRGRAVHVGKSTAYRYHCIPGCSYIHVYEVDYPYSRATNASFFAGDQGKTFTSISSRVKLRHCLAGEPADRSFSVEFISLDKNERHQGMVAQYNHSMGTLRAPNFPHGYALNGDTFTYMIQNLDPYGHVRMMALDWDIAPESDVKVYDGYGENAPSITLERFRRPVLVSESSALVLVFNTGHSKRRCCYHAGFKIAFEFVSGKSWPQRPATDCSATYALQGGGMIDFTGTASGPGLYDCVWVIKRHGPDNDADAVVLRLTEVLLGDGWLKYGRLNALDIHDGPTSESRLLNRYTAKNMSQAPPAFRGASGLYLRLTGGFYNTDKLSFIFTAVKDVTDKGVCPDVFNFMCKSLMCIDQDLMCDGVDHCGDASDEKSSDLDCSMSPLFRLSFKWSMPYVAEVEAIGQKTTQCAGFTCRHGRRCVAFGMLCDGVRDCQDGEDEKYCYATTQSYLSTAAGSGHDVTCSCLKVLFSVQLTTTLWAMGR